MPLPTPEQVRRVGDLFTKATTALQTADTVRESIAKLVRAMDESNVSVADVQDWDVVIDRQIAAIQPQLADNAAAAQAMLVDSATGPIDPSPAILVNP